MKALAKLGLLLALVVAGRYMRLTDSTTFPKQEKTTVRLVRPSTLHFTSFYTAQASPLAPAGQRTLPVKRQTGQAPLAWY